MIPLQRDSIMEKPNIEENTIEFIVKRFTALMQDALLPKQFLIDGMKKITQYFLFQIT